VNKLNKLTILPENVIQALSLKEEDENEGKEAIVAS
jgi:hypothetical protein